MNTAQIDLINNGAGQGMVANALQKGGSLSVFNKRPYLNENGIPCVTVFNGGDVKDPRNYRSVFAVNRGLAVNADLTLRVDEWKQLDEAITAVSREELTVFDYFAAKGLVKPLANAFGTSVLRWQSVSDSQEAIMTMDAVVRSQGDRVQYKDSHWPIPILHSDYEINARFLAISRSTGNGVDVEEAQNAARRIMEKKEDLFIGTGTYSFGGGTMYSLLNFPDRNEVALNASWTASGTTTANIIDDVRNLKRANKDALHGGEGVIIIPSEYEDVLGEDYAISGGSLMTVRERIMKLGGITDIIVSERLATDNVLFVELRTRTVEVINGMPMQNIMWTTEGGMVAKHKVMEIALPRFKSDYYGHSGIAHGTV